MFAYHRLAKATGAHPTANRAPADRRLPGVILSALAAVAMSVLIAACGGSSANQAPAGQHPNGPPDRQQFQADAVKFTKCLREHGVAAQSEAGPHGNRIRIGGPSGPGAPPAAVEAAQRACRRYLPDEGRPPKLSPAEEAKAREAALKFARCMRSHGVDIPDPSADGTLELGGDVNPQSATFEAAQSACGSLAGKVQLRISTRHPGAGTSQSPSPEASRAGG